MDGQQHLAAGAEAAVNRQGDRTAGAVRYRGGVGHLPAPLFDAGADPPTLTGRGRSEFERILGLHQGGISRGAHPRNLLALLSYRRARARPPSCPAGTTNAVAWAGWGR